MKENVTLLWYHYIGYRYFKTKAKSHLFFTYIYWILPRWSRGQRVWVLIMIIFIKKEIVILLWYRYIGFRYFKTKAKSNLFFYIFIGRMATPRRHQQHQDEKPSVPPGNDWCTTRTSSESVRSVMHKHLLNNHACEIAHRMRIRWAVPRKRRP